MQQEHDPNLSPGGGDEDDQEGYMHSAMGSEQDRQEREQEDPIQD